VPQIPSDLTFKIQRGDLRSFVSAIQYGSELNPWDAWIERLESTGKRGNSIFVWEDGLGKAPFCTLIRHVFVYMNGAGLFDKPAAEEFVKLCLEAQNAPQNVLLAVLPAAWEKLFV
jgi:hypothetical protein